MTIAEPVTLLTDYALGAFGLFLALRLAQRARRAGQRSVLLWAGALAAMALASVLGGTYHGFAPVLGAPAAAALWLATLYAIGLASFLVWCGTGLAALTEGRRQWVLGLALAQLLGYGVLATRAPEFRYAIYDYGIALAGAFSLQALGPRGLRTSAFWMGAGLAASLAGAAVQRSDLVVGRYLSHNDLYHLVQMGAAYLFYRGARLLRDRRDG